MDVLLALDDCAGRMQHEDVRLKDIINEKSRINVTDSELDEGVDRLIYNHSLNKTKIREIVNLSTKTFNKRLAALEEEGEIGEPIEQGKSFLYNRFDVQVILDHLGHRKYRDDFTPTAVSVQNHKGGTGKSTTTRSLATAAALDLNLNARVCILDLDPQGSAGLQAQPKDDDGIYLTIADIALRKYTPSFNEYVENYGLTEEEVVLGAAFNTHLPNLDVYSAFPEDEIFSDIYAELDEEGKAELLQELRHFILPILKQHYDIIFIDTPPQDSPICWSALEATDFLLLPVTPHKLDYLSTKNFITFIKDRIRQLPSGGDQLKMFKCLRVNVDSNSPQVEQTSNMIIRSFVEHLCSNSIKHSELFLAADNLNRSIFDIQKTEARDNKYASASAYDNAVVSTKAVYEEVMANIKKISGQVNS